VPSWRAAGRCRPPRREDGCPRRSLLAVSRLRAPAGRRGHRPRRGTFERSGRREGAGGGGLGSHLGQRHGPLLPGRHHPLSRLHASTAQCDVRPCQTHPSMRRELLDELEGARERSAGATLTSGAPHRSSAERPPLADQGGRVREAADLTIPPPAHDPGHGSLWSRQSVLDAAARQERCGHRPPDEPDAAGGVVDLPHDCGRGRDREEGEGGGQHRRHRALRHRRRRPDGGVRRPTGAAILAWQAGKHTGVQLANEANTLVWSDLCTPDVEKARSFYRGPSGWSRSRSRAWTTPCSRQATARSAGCVLGATAA
jgi:hypothetical protein